MHVGGGERVAADPPVATFPLPRDHRVSELADNLALLFLAVLHHPNLNKCMEFLTIAARVAAGARWRLLLPLSQKDAEVQLQENFNYWESCYVGNKSRRDLVMRGRCRPNRRRNRTNDVGPRENRARPAIDPMLRSTAVCYAHRAAGAVHRP